MSYVLNLSIEIYNKHYNMKTQNSVFVVFFYLHFTSTAVSLSSMIKLYYYNIILCRLLQYTSNTSSNSDVVLVSFLSSSQTVQRVEIHRIYYTVNCNVHTHDVTNFVIIASDFSFYLPLASNTTREEIIHIRGQTSCRSMCVCVCVCLRTGDPNTD